MNVSLALLHILASVLTYPGREWKRKSSENINYTQRYFHEISALVTMQCMSALDHDVKYINWVSVKNV